MQGKPLGVVAHAQTSEADIAVGIDGPCRSRALKSLVKVRVAFPILR